MNKRIRIYAIAAILLVLSLKMVSQGLINNGAYIVLNNGPYIYINGSTGNYMNQDASTNRGRIAVNTSGSIQLNGNWTNNSADVTNKVFTTNAGTVNFIGNTQSINGTATTYFNNLNLAGTAGSTKTLNVNTLVGGGYVNPLGVLSVGSDILDLNQHTLTINNPNTTAVTYGSGYILSETNVAVNPSIIQWNMGTVTGAHIFPFGVASVQIPFTFNKLTSTDANIQVSTRATAASDNLPWAGISDANTVPAVNNMNSVWGGSAVTSVIDRWWDIYSAAGVTANVTFSYRGIENTMTSNPNGPIQAQHWNGSIWELPVGSGTGLTVGVGTCTMNGISAFSPWVLVSADHPLPIQLLDFSAECNHDEVAINWSTASEVNNKYFTLQKSKDANDFYDLLTINGQGNSNHLVNYSFSDKHPFIGNTYYRLKQTDFNGDYTLSNIITTNCNINNGLEILNVFGDFNNQNTAIIYNVSQSGTCHISIYDVLGNQVLSTIQHAEMGINKVNLNCSSLSNSIYFLSITDGSKSITHKFIY